MSLVVCCTDVLSLIDDLVVCCTDVFSLIDDLVVCCTDVLSLIDDLVVCWADVLSLIDEPSGVLYRCVESATGGLPVSVCGDSHPAVCGH